MMEAGASRNKFVPEQELGNKKLFIDWKELNIDVFKITKEI